MAIAIDGTPSQGLDYVQNLTISHTVGSGSNRALFVICFHASTTDKITGVTYNGVAMTRQIFQKEAGSSTGVYIYSLVAPDSGTHNVVVSGDATDTYGAFVIGFTGVDQTTPVYGSPAGSYKAGDTSISTNITVPSGGVALDGIQNVDNGAFTAGGGQTTIGTQITTLVARGAWASYKTDATAMSWTTPWQQMNQAVLAINPAAATSPIPVLLTALGEY